MKTGDGLQQAVASEALRDDNLFEISDNAMDELRLFRSEVFWRDLYLWFEEKGYRLRPRYHPDWVASWKAGDNWLLCEDAQVELNVETVNTATRISDGAQVTLKRLGTSPVDLNEIKICRLFSSPPYNSNPANHCVPIYDVLELPDKDINFIVMPFLSFWERPPLETVGEAIDCIRQMFQGLAFMHSLNIAHNDTKWDNFMMDSAPLYDEPVHPANFAMNKDFTRRSKPQSRTTRPVKYYYVDFGNTRQYNPEDGTPQCLVPYGGDATVPEFKTQKYCDPYPVDVYRVGNIIREHFTEGDPLCDFSKYGFDFLSPLLKDMCQDDPMKRPTMEEVLTRFEATTQQLGWWKLRSHVVKKEDGRIAQILSFPGHWTRQVSRIIRRLPAVPRFK